MRGLKLSSWVMMALGLMMSPARAEPTESVKTGQSIAWSRSQGNCLACHYMPDAEFPGNIGPPLIGMKSRFPDRSVLRAQVWDATTLNPDTMMPPYGRHQILTEEEIDQVVDYLYAI
jgi:sulfur-oxidizing protein SoxX